MTPLRILGIDPALRVTGYGAVSCTRQRVTLLEAGIIAPRTDRSLERRLHDLHAAVTSVIEQTSPDVVVIEELYTTYKNPVTAILMGHARGVMCLASAAAGLPVHTIGHSHVKRALTGSGSAKKDQVNAMVTQLLRLKAPPKPNDVSDALALALAFHALNSAPSAIRDAADPAFRRAQRAKIRAVAGLAP